MAAPSPVVPSIDRFAAISTVASGGAALRVYATPDTDRMPLLFLHANVCDSRMWTREFEALGRNADKPRRVVAFDRRGFGATKAVGDVFANVDDTIGVMDALGLRRAVLVGSSNGGRIALDTCIAHPDRVAGLVLVCGAIGGMPWDGRMDPRIAALETQYDAAVSSGDRKTAARLAAHIWLDGPFEPEGRVAGDTRALFLDMMAGVLAAPEADGKAIVPDTAYARLATLRVPTLVVWGTLDDPLVTAMMTHAAATMLNAQPLEMAATAHLPNLERPDLFGPAVARFVEALD